MDTNNVCRFCKNYAEQTFPYAIRHYCCYNLECISRIQDKHWMKLPKVHFFNAPTGRSLAFWTYFLSRFGKPGFDRFTDEEKYRQIPYKALEDNGFLVSVVEYSKGLV